MDKIQLANKLIKHKAFLKNGKKSSSGSTDEYQSETAFKKIYKSYLLI